MNNDPQQTRLAAGFYKGRAIAGSEQYAVAGTGTEQIVVDFGVPALSRTLSIFFSFSERAAPYSIEKLRACGWQGDDLSRLVGIDTNEVDVSIKYETWDGKERMKVDVSTGGGRVQLENVMTEAQKRAFAARMKAAVQGSNALGGRVPAPPRAQAPAPAQRREGAYDPGPTETDDIPL